MCGCSGHERHDDCGCREQPGERHGHHPFHGPGHPGHGPGCCCGAPQGHVFGRRFATREEQVARLERYLQDLRAEAQAVEERITGMRAE